MKETNFFFLLKVWRKTNPWNFRTTRCIFCEVWCKRCLLYDQKYFLLLFGWVEGGGGVSIYLLSQLTPLSPVWTFTVNITIWWERWLRVGLTLANWLRPTRPWVDIGPTLHRLPLPDVGQTQAANVGPTLAFRPRSIRPLPTLAQRNIVSWE